MRPIVVIPARFESSRLPGKPLIDLLGQTVLLRTYRRCVEAVPAEDVYVATDDERIRAHCAANGAKVVMTSPDCATGTDRVAEVARLIPADVYVNVQGDEPLCNPLDITAIIEAARRHPGEVLNGYCPIDSEDLFRNPTIPKVVLRPDGRLLYMSRNAIPSTKTHGFVRAWRQVCIYAFNAMALGAFSANTTKTPLEQLEDIEILRFIELGYEVRMVPMSATSIAVDTPEDVERVLEVLRLPVEA